MTKYLVLLFAYVATAPIALAADVMGINPSGVQVPLEVIGAAYLLLRFTAEGLGKLAQKTSNTWDNKIAAGLAAAANFAGWGLGLFGVGSPKSISSPFSKPAEDKK